MYEPLRNRALELLKVPPEPRPPMGDPASLRVFRAGRNYYKLRMAAWAAAQLLALAGIVFWAAVLIDVEAGARSEGSARARKPTDMVIPAGAGDAVSPPQDARKHREKQVADFVNKLKSAPKAKGGAWVGFKQFFVELALLLPPWAFPLVWAVKIFSFVIYLLQIPITYTVRRLDYELRWYMVTDRSLRLRHGVWKVVESTMSFANLQEVVMTQGPVQRLLGLADVKVKSAGGGGESPNHRGEDMHVGIFHSVTNAPEIRDLILERLRRYRESGLGDPDEPVVSTEAVAAPENVGADTIIAARELAAEARALRVALSGGGRGQSELAS